MFFHLGINMISDIWSKLLMPRERNKWFSDFVFKIVTL